MGGCAAARLDEIDELDDGVNACWARAAGNRIATNHDEAEPDANEELYLALEARAVFEPAASDPRRRPTLVFVRPGVTRVALADGPGTTIVAAGGLAGKAYDAAGWELWAPVAGRYRAGRFAKAADRGRELVESHREYPVLFFNLACCASLAERRVDAREHLRHAVEHAERLRSSARDDSDLDPIRDEPAFNGLIAG